MSGVRSASSSGSCRRDLAEGRADLAAEEERLFEQTLAGSIRRSLANRIRQANRLVAGINEQLGRSGRRRPGWPCASTGRSIPTNRPPVRSARSLLLKDRVTDEERRDLQEFVRARVDQARAELEHHAPWEARLRESLDYRAWHRFTLQITHQDWEGWQPATPKRTAAALHRGAFDRPPPAHAGLHRRPLRRRGRPAVWGAPG